MHVPHALGGPLGARITGDRMAFLLPISPTMRDEDHDLRPTARSSALPLPARVLRLRACPCCARICEIGEAELAGLVLLGQLAYCSGPLSAPHALMRRSKRA